MNNKNIAILTIGIVLAIGILCLVFFKREKMKNWILENIDKKTQMIILKVYVALLISSIAMLAIVGIVCLVMFNGEKIKEFLKNKYSVVKIYTQDKYSVVKIYTQDKYLKIKDSIDPNTEIKEKVFELFNFVNNGYTQYNDPVKHVESVKVYNDEIKVTLEYGLYWTEQTFINRMNGILNNHKEATAIGMRLFYFFHSCKGIFKISIKEFNYLYDLIILRKFDQTHNISNLELNLDFIKLRSDYLNLERKLNSISDRLDGISISRQNEVDLIEIAVIYE